MSNRMFRSCLIQILGVFLCTSSLWAAVGQTSAEQDTVYPKVKTWLAGLSHQTPILRVGLVDAHDIEVSSRQSFSLKKADGSSIGKANGYRRLTFVAEGGPEDGATKTYSIQVGAFSDEATAQARATALSKQYNAKGQVKHDPDRGVYRVRLGLERDRLKLNDLLERLRAGGLNDVWVSEDPAEVIDGVSLTIVDPDYNATRPGLDRLFIVPKQDGVLEIDGTRYRGILEIRRSRYGTLAAINWVDLEQYLRGVVPAELGPAVWPKLEAQKAQTIAARTYVWRHRGQFEEDGYDLCDTPRCQVYKGRNTEHPLSDRAIESTRHQILTYEGRPINAYFTSTCGGHTENVEHVFPEEAPEDRAYLRGVPCRGEKSLLDQLGGTLTGKAPRTLPSSLRGPAASYIHRFIAKGIWNDTDIQQAEEPVTAEHLHRWAKALNRLSGRSAQVGSAPALRTLQDVVDYWYQLVGWAERPNVLIESSDLPGLLRGYVAAPYSVKDRALAYAIFRKSIPQALPSLQAQRLPTVEELWGLVADVADAWEVLELKSGSIAKVSGNRLTLSQGQGERSISVNPEVVIIQNGAGEAIPVQKLVLWPGDRIQYLTGNGVDYLELRAPVKGLSDDRSSARYAWEVRKTRGELERTIRRRLSVGRLKDLKVLERGVSGRISALEVIGTEGKAIVRGFDVRRLLDLQESLTVMEPIRSSSGQLQAVVFAGKGWGHGVGMCQVGAYGMAVRGLKYTDILSHYYQGSQLQKVQ